MLWDYDVIALDPTFSLRAFAASTETLQVRSVCRLSGQGVVDWFLNLAVAYFWFGCLIPKGNSLH